VALLERFGGMALTGIRLKTLAFLQFLRAYCIVDPIIEEKR
jgi:hypothetical protein